MNIGRIFRGGDGAKPPVVVSSVECNQIYRYGRSTLHWVIENATEGELDGVFAQIDGFSADEKVDIFTKKGYLGQTILGVLTARSAITQERRKKAIGRLFAIVSTLDEERKFQVLKTPLSSADQTIFEQVLTLDDCETADILPGLLRLIQGLHESHQREIVKESIDCDWEVFTFKTFYSYEEELEPMLILIAKSGIETAESVKAFRALFLKVGENNPSNILKACDQYGRTVLHTEIELGTDSNFLLIPLIQAIENLTIAEQFEVLNKRDVEKRTVLHSAIATWQTDVALRLLKMIDQFSFGEQEKIVFSEKFFLFPVLLFFLLLTKREFALFWRMFTLWRKGSVQN